MFYVSNTEILAIFRELNILLTIAFQSDLYDWHQIYVCFQNTISELEELS